MICICWLCALLGFQVVVEAISVAAEMNVEPIPVANPLSARIIALTESLRTADDVKYAASCFGMVDGNGDFVNEQVKICVCQNH
jgi:hypothetical protein